MTTPTPSTQLVVIPDLEKAVKLALITSESALAVRETYVPHFTTFLELEKEAANVAVNSPKAARELRLKLRKVRTSADKDRKTLGDNARKFVDAVNEVNNILLTRLEPVENRMEQIEKDEEIREAKRIAALHESRRVELLPFADPTHYDLGNMVESSWTQLLLGAKAAKQAQIDAAKAEEAKRVAAEKAAAEARKVKEAEEAKEKAHLQAENEKLAKIAQAEKAAREIAEAKAAQERKVAQAKVDAERARLVKEAADLAAKVAQEKAALEAEATKQRAALESKAKQEREAAEKVAQAERVKREALEKEVAAAKDREAARVAHEAKVKADQEKARQAEAAQKVEAEKLAAQKAASKPDKAKLLAYATSIKGLPAPFLTSEKGRLFNPTLHGQIKKMLAWLEKEAEKL